MSAVDPVVAEVVRSGFVEGRHHGALVALAADGSVAWSVGSVDVPMLPRSCNKPLQAAAMLRLGLSLPPEHVALACASHSGEPMHLDGVRKILASGGLTEDDLQNVPDLPLADSAREEMLRSGAGPTRLAMNCSGKHAAMLVTCVANGWDTASYLDASHPLQAGIRSHFAELTGVPVDTVAIDGCGAPLLSTTLLGLASAFRRLALSTSGAEAEVADAIRSHPELVSGTTRDELQLHRAVPGLVGKAGAEGCYAVALPDGRAVALKVWDGSARARPVLMATALQRLGVDTEPGVDGAAVRATGDVPVLGGGRVVGEIRATI